MIKEIKRAEFIKQYCDASNIEDHYRTEDGYKINDDVGFIAVACRCGEDDCLGWAMISNKPWVIAQHMTSYGGGAEGDGGRARN